ncbi:hypothetical protein CIPAW_06G096400 [Carya illinoinensis]|uniref:Uncharacterized protein n=1 Tax=Carya illinoinensis TaxID=32201 RepID=A0A8T1QA67_CARIL|nr:hypothetical protein CIPAW_06G096400 [Carya illinoinensis]
MPSTPLDPTPPSNSKGTEESSKMQVVGSSGISFFTVVEVTLSRLYAGLACVHPKIGNFDLH